MEVKFFKINLAFTLAEVIIVMGVIGIIAAVTLPSLITNVTDHAFLQSQELTLKKIREATSQMKTNDVLVGYATSDAFVNEFAKYIKTTKRCSSSNLANCFVSSFKTAEGDEIKLNKLTTGSSLGHTSYNSPLVGLQIINGTNVLLAFNPACPRINTWDNTSDTTACLSMVYDINGFGPPNKIGKDITLLNAVLSTCDGADLNGICISGGDTTYTPINTCDGSADLAYDPLGNTNTTCAANYWAGAKKACVTLGMRAPTKDELNMIYQAYNNGQLPGLGFPNPYPYSQYWTSTEYNPSSPTIALTTHFPLGGNLATSKGASNIKLRCVK